MATPSWLSGSLRIFCIFLLCILVTSFKSLLLLLGPYCFVFYCAHPCMKCSLGISNFLEEIPSLSHSVVFLYFLHSSFKKPFLSLLVILWELCIQLGISFPFLLFASLLSSALRKASSGNHFAFLHFFFFGIILVTNSCTML